jgi:hypothetical protein
MPPSNPDRTSRWTDAWVSLAVGGVLLVAFPRILEYYVAPGSFTWTFVDRDGAPLAYPASAFFLVDVGVLAWAIASVVDGVASLVPRRAAVAVALAASAISVVLNVFVAIKVSSELGFQLLPALAIACGGYVARQRGARLSRPA